MRLSRDCYSPSKFIGLIKAFGRHQRGAVLIYVTLLLPVIVGTAVLAVDASRLYNLQTHLQKAADALALTGAAELDGETDSVDRAKAAITALLNSRNQQRFAEGLVPISVNVNDASEVRFLKNLPEDDADPIESQHLAGTDQTEARFVEVTVAPATMNTVLPASFIGGSDTVNAAATAVAGFKSVVCRVMPMFICNPFENSGIDILTNPDALGRLIRMRAGPSTNDPYGPGNFGWLDVSDFDSSDTSNANVPKLKEYLAGTAPPVCIEQDGEVNTQTGSIQSLIFALNVRFDIYDANYSSPAQKAAYPPDQNVRKGYSVNGNAYCNASPYYDANGVKPYSLGRDQTWDTAGASQGRMGLGDWDVEGYFQRVHGYAVNAALPNGWVNAVPVGNGFNRANTPTRLEVYNWEIANNLISTSVSFNGGSETGSPACEGGSGLANRRLLFAAIINCQGLTDPIIGATSDVPILAFGKFFMTEPIALASEEPSEAGTIFAEFVEVINPGNTTSDVVRDIVQLYR